MSAPKVFHTKSLRARTLVIERPRCLQPITIVGAKKYFLGAALDWSAELQVQRGLGLGFVWLANQNEFATEEQYRELDTKMTTCWRNHYYYYGRV